MQHGHYQEPSSDPLPEDSLSSLPASTLKPFLKKNSGLSAGQAACTSGRYVPKGGFIKVFDEITDSKPIRHIHRTPTASKRSVYPRYCSYELHVSYNFETSKNETLLWSGYNDMHRRTTALSVSLNDAPRKHKD